MKHLWMTSLLALAACGATAQDARYPSVTRDAEPVRSAFNAAKGKVRAIFLAAPA